MSHVRTPFATYFPTTIAVSVCILDPSLAESIRENLASPEMDRRYILPPPPLPDPGVPKA